MPPHRVARPCFIAGVWRVYVELPILTLDGTATYAYLIGDFIGREVAAEVAYHFREYGAAAPSVEYAMAKYASCQGSVEQEEVF